MMMRLGIFAALFSIAATVALAQAESEKPEIVAVNAPGVVNPKIKERVDCFKGFYTLAMGRAGEQGLVAMTGIIGIDGVPRDVVVETSSGHQRVDAAALACVRVWRYVPGTKDGKPVEVIFKPQVLFRLQ